MSTTVLIVTYCRVSTEEQSKHGYSLADQRRECLARARQIAAELGTEPEIHEFQDAASGEVLDRPGLEACRAFIRQQPVQYFVCLGADRFSRSLYLQLLVADEIRSARVQLVFVTADYADTPEGRLFFQMHGAIAEFEKAKIRERSARGRRQKLAQGGIPNRVKPWGYLWDTRAHTLQVDPTQAVWVQRVYEWYVAGWSYQRIAEKLMELGVPPAGEGPVWYRGSIRRVLRNSVYMGQLILNRHDCAGLTVLSQVRKEKRGRPLTAGVKPPEEWVTVQVPALVSEELWTRAQSEKAGRNRLMQRGIGLLSGLCVCGVCGEGMHYMGAAPPRRLRCVARYPKRREGGPELRNAAPCASRHVKAAPIEAALWQRIKAWMTNPDELAQEQARQREQRPVDQVALRRAAEVERELSERREEHRRMFALAAKGLAPDGVEADLERLKRSVRALEAELLALSSVTKAANSGASDLVATVEQIAAEVGDELDRLDLAGRQRLVRMLVSRITVWPDGRWAHTLK